MAPWPFRKQPYLHTPSRRIPHRRLFGISALSPLALLVLLPTPLSTILLLGLGKLLRGSAHALGLMLMDTSIDDVRQGLAIIDDALAVADSYCN